MSAIDCYKHEHIGFVRCLMRHRVVFGNSRVFDFLPVYRLLEDVVDEPSLSGRAGDIVIGGGSGEADALTFCIPEIFTAFKTTDNNDGDRKPPFLCHWSPSTYFISGIGFEALGWNPEQQSLTIWLAEHLTAFLIRVYPDRYSKFVGEFPQEQNGEIFYQTQ